MQEQQGDTMSLESEMGRFNPESSTTMIVDAESLTPEELELLQDIEQHVQANTVPADNSKRKCVDGGYQVGEAEGALARAGADLGASMALLKLGFTPQESFQLVFDFVTSRGQKYCWHTDTHVDPAETDDHHHASSQEKVGCGHCNAAIKVGEKYGVSGESVDQLLTIVRTMQERQPEDMECVVLDRDHAERAILVVQSTDLTVRPWGKDKGDQYFISDAARDAQYLSDLFYFIREQKGKRTGKAEVMVQPGKYTTFNKFQDAVGEQTHATLGLLNSSKGKMLVEVMTTQDEKGRKMTKIKKLGYAPVIEVAPAA